MSAVESVESLVRESVTSVQPVNSAGEPTGDRGTAFFVGPDIVLTCAHVIGEAPNARLSLAGGTVLGEVAARYKSGPVVFAALNTGYPDLAVLRVPNYQHKTWVLFSEHTVAPGDKLSAVGFPEVGGSVANPIPTSFEAVGFAGPPSSPYLKVQGGTIRPGNSGGPVYGARAEQPSAVVGWMVATEGADHFVVPWEHARNLVSGWSIPHAHPDNGQRWRQALSALTLRMQTDRRLSNALVQMFRERKSAGDDDLHVAPRIPPKIKSRVCRKNPELADAEFIAVIDISGYWPAYCFITFTTVGMTYSPPNSLGRRMDFYLSYDRMRSNTMSVDWRTRTVGAGQARSTEDRVHITGYTRSKGLQVGRASGWYVTRILTDVQEVVDEFLP